MKNVRLTGEIAMKGKNTILIKYDWYKLFCNYKFIYAIYTDQYFFSFTALGILIWWCCTLL